MQRIKNPLKYLINDFMFELRKENPQKPKPHKMLSYPIKSLVYGRSNIVVGFGTKKKF